MPSAWPMSAMFGNVPIAVGYGNSTGAPSGFIISTVLLLLFSIGYVAMVRKYTSAGGFYSFISYGLGRPAGMAAGWSSMAAYCLFEAGEWGIFAYFTKSTFHEYLGINLPWLVYAFGGCALVALLTYFDVELSARILGVALLLEAAVLLVMDVVILAKGSADSVSASLSISGALNGANIAAPAAKSGSLVWVRRSEETPDGPGTCHRRRDADAVAPGPVSWGTAWTRPPRMRPATAGTSSQHSRAFVGLVEGRQAGDHHQHLRLRDGLPHRGDALLLRDGP